MNEYEDFSIKIIWEESAKIYRVYVTSPAGNDESSFRLPFALDDLNDILSGLGEAVRGARRGAGGAQLNRIRPQEIGAQLFNALFTGGARDRFLESLGRAGGKGLRIKLEIDPDDPGLLQLASLPWEFLYRPETRDFLNLSPKTPVVRRLDIPRPYTPLPLEPPLRILVVISNPDGYPRLDLARERGNIEKIFAGQDVVRVDFLERASVAELYERLSGRDVYHVLHYMGHGDFEDETGHGVLMMEDEDGGGKPLSGETLKVLLNNLPNLRLVFLNACESAKITRKEGLDPFAGVATALVMAGIPAVVAMQFPISDRAAVQFSRYFYRNIAQGEAVDVAVVEGRRAIRIEGETMEWGTPVLFMQAPQGDIFNIARPSLPEAAASSRQERTGTPAATPIPQPGGAQKLLAFLRANTGQIALGLSLFLFVAVLILAAQGRPGRTGSQSPTAPPSVGALSGPTETATETPTATAGAANEVAPAVAISGEATPAAPITATAPEPATEAPTPTPAATATRTDTPAPTETATSPPANTPPPTREANRASLDIPPLPGGCDARGGDLVDDFSDPSSGWRRHRSDTGESAYDEGRYRISLFAPDYVKEGLRKECYYYFDLRVEVKRESDIAAGGYARIHFGITGDSYYQFVIHTTGAQGVQLWKIDKQHETSTRLTSLVGTSAIRPGESINRIRLRLVDNTLDMYVNDEHVGTARNLEPVWGTLALAGCSCKVTEEGVINFYFDNFALQTLE
jgi:hypothetical protein